MNQFTKNEKNHVRKNPPVSYTVLAEDPKNAVLNLWNQFRDVKVNYLYWKAKMKEINSNLVSLKKAKTSHYLAERNKIEIVDSIYDLDTINQKLFWWRSYYPKALDCYLRAKNHYVKAQTYCLKYTEEKKGRMSWNEYIQYKKYNGGEYATVGFKRWLIENAGFTEDVLKGLTKTLHYWDRFYNMWEKGETPKSKKNS